MTNKTKKIILLCSCGLLAGFAGFSVFVVYLLNSWGPVLGNEPDHEPDAVLIKNFDEHRAQFEELRQMIIRDSSMTRVDYNWTDPENLPDDVVTDYRRRFKGLKIPRGISATLDRSKIEFIASAQGWVASGSSKGYAYLAERPREVENDLDHYLEDERHEAYAFRRIEGNWYLFFER